MWYLQVLFDTIVIALLFFSVSLVEDFSDYFDVSDNDYSIVFVEEATYSYSCVIIIFQTSFYYLHH